MHTITELQQFVETAIRKINYPEHPSKLYEPIRYVMGLGGKRIRPILVLMAGELFTSNLEQPLHAAMAIETFHNFTLIHDDIMDNAPLRRGQTTVHEKWGVNNAILSGDVMMVEANKQLAKLSADVFKQALETYNHTAEGVCQGQQLDMEFETRDDVKIAEYIEMIRLKTAVLLGGAMKLGAEVGGAGPEDAKNLYLYGEYLGIAFQLQDDILDVYSNPEKFGKQVGGDIIANKKTWLMLQALKLASEEEASLMLAHVGPDEIDNKVKAVTNIYNKYGVRQMAEIEINKYILSANKAIDAVGVAPERKAKLKELASSLLKREN